MAKVINFYRESAIPAVLVFRRSMDKNALKSVAVYGMPRYCTNLRVVSDYPGIFGKFSNKIGKDISQSTICNGAQTNRYEEDLRVYMIDEMDYLWGHHEDSESYVYLGCLQYAP